MVKAQWLALRHRWQTPPAKPSSPGTSIQSGNWLNWYCRKWEKGGPIEGWPVLQILIHMGETKYFYPIPDIEINLDSSKFALNAKFCIQVTTHIINFIIQGVGGNTFTRFKILKEEWWEELTKYYCIRSECLIIKRHGKKIKAWSQGRIFFLISWLEMSNKPDKHDQPSRPMELNHKLGLLVRRQSSGRTIEENGSVMSDWGVT